MDDVVQLKCKLLEAGSRACAEVQRPLRAVVNCSMVGCFTFRTVALYIHRNNWVIIAGQLDKAIASLHHLALSFCSRPIVGSTPPLLYIDVISRIVHTHIRHIPTQFLILFDEIV